MHKTGFSVEDGMQRAQIASGRQRWILLTTINVARAGGCS
jgi:hypothetical protein